MRNVKNEVKEFSEIVSIIAKCDTINLAFFDEEYPYIVPLNFGEEIIGDQICFYVHTGYKGKKIDLVNSSATSNRASLGFALRTFPVLPDC